MHTQTMCGNKEKLNERQVEKNALIREKITHIHTQQTTAAAPIKMKKNKKLINGTATREKEIEHCTR